MSNIFDKFKHTQLKDRTGEYKYRARETKRDKFTRNFINVKGQIILKMRVISYKKIRNTLVRDFVSLEEIIIEKSRISDNIKDIVDNAKLQAIYSHYRKKGDISLINDTKRLKNEIVKIDLIDYMINYNKGYNRKLGVSRLRFEQDPQGNIDTFIYNEERKDYSLYSSTKLESVKDRRDEIENIKIKQEKNYTKIY